MKPGEILRAQLKKHGVTAYKLAKQTGLSQALLSRIMSDKQPITLNTAVKLGQYFGNHPQFWINLQNEYELQKIESEHG